MDQNKGLRATRAAQEKAKIVTMQSGIASRAIGLGSRLGWVWAGRLASWWMKSLHHHHDGICEITQWNTMSSELCTMALLICCKFCGHLYRGFSPYATFGTLKNLH